MLATNFGERILNSCDLPASLQIPMDKVPTRQSNSSIKSAMIGEAIGRKKQNETSQKLLVDAHLRHSVGKLQDIGKENLSSCNNNLPVSILQPIPRIPSLGDPPCLMKSLRWCHLTS